MTAENELHWTVDSWIGIFLSLGNTNDHLLFSHIVTILTFGDVM